MSRQPWIARLTLWVAVGALLLKAAVPMLASVSAQVQGVALAEVCTVYGVATVALADAGTEHDPAQGAAHRGEHCALSAVMALAVPGVPQVAMQVAHPHRAQTLPPPPSPQAPDACATWVARLKHGPPALA